MRLNVLFVLCLLISTDLWSIHRTTLSTMSSDSLVLEQQNGDKEEVIRKGDELSVWSEHMNRFRGTFDRVENSHVIVVKEGQEIAVAFDDIKKIKRFNSKGERSAGALIKALSFFPGVLGSIFFLGGILEVLGVVTVSGAFIGVGFAVFLGLLVLGIGIGIFGVGDRVEGKRFNLKRKWRIKK